MYKLLSQQIVPAITAELRVSDFFRNARITFERKKQEIQRKRQLEEAVSQRKRSSRLAVKENEKEEARLAAVKKAEEEEKLSRARRLEARQKREEGERLKREAAREKRRLDREERERTAQAGAEQQWVIFLGHFARSLSFAGRTRIRWSTSLKTTHYYARLPLNRLKAGLADQKRRRLLRRAPRPAQVVREHQWAKIGYWIAIFVIVLGSTRSMNSPVPRGNDRLHSLKTSAGRWVASIMLWQVLKVAAHSVSRLGGSPSRTTETRLGQRRVYLSCMSGP